MIDVCGCLEFVLPALIEPWTYMYISQHMSEFYLKLVLHDLRH